MTISRKRILTIWAIICAMLVLFLPGSRPVLADDASLVMTLPVHAEFGSGGLNASKTYQLILTPEDADNPMPAGSESGIYTAEISREAGTDYEVRIGFSGVGEYWYQLTAQDKTGREIGTWFLHVTVQHLNGNLSLVTTLHDKTRTGDKTDSLTLIDTEQPTPTPTAVVTNSPVPSRTATVTPAGTTPGTKKTNTKTTAPGRSSSAVKASSVKTGDPNHPLMWKITFAVSAAVLVLFLVLIVRERRRQDE
ncbi:MAG: hypothetical protein ACI4D6_09955 [Chordicoccus sp.]